MGRPREITDQQIIAAARRCFLQRGTAVSAADIAKELGVSHTTLFHRFGSKEALMMAALGAPQEIEWVATLDSGPDTRPLREQLMELAKVMSDHFRDLQAGLGLLQAAGIATDRLECPRTGASAPAQAYRAFVAWLERAVAQRRLARCDVETLAATILGALHGRAATSRVCGGASDADDNDRYVERFIDLLWTGIGPDS